MAHPISPNHFKEENPNGISYATMAGGILYAPDFAVNVGGAMAILGLETLGWDRDCAEKEITASVRQALHQVFVLAAEKDMTTEEAAEFIADERLQK